MGAASCVTFSQYPFLQRCWLLNTTSPPRSSSGPPRWLMILQSDDWLPGSHLLAPENLLATSSSPCLQVLTLPASKAPSNLVEKGPPTFYFPLTPNTHYTGGEAEARKGTMTCRRSHSKVEMELKSDSGLCGFIAPAFTHHFISSDLGSTCSPWHPKSTQP